MIKDFYQNEIIRSDCVVQQGVLIHEENRIHVAPNQYNLFISIFI